MRRPTHEREIKMRLAMEPDKEDYDAVEKEYGPLPPDAGDAVTAEYYRLAQANKLIRVYGLSDTAAGAVAMAQNE